METAIVQCLKTLLYVFFRRVKEVRASLDPVYPAKGRDDEEKSTKFPKVCVFIL